MRREVASPEIEAAVNEVFYEAGFVSVDTAGIPLIIGMTTGEIEIVSVEVKTRRQTLPKSQRQPLPAGHHHAVRQDTLADHTLPKRRRRIDSARIAAASLMVGVAASLGAAMTTLVMAAAAVL